MCDIHTHTHNNKLTSHFLKSAETSGDLNFRFYIWILHYCNTEKDYGGAVPCYVHLKHNKDKHPFIDHHVDKGGH